VREAIDGGTAELKVRSPQKWPQSSIGTSLACNDVNLQTQFFPTVEKTATIEEAQAEDPQAE
jgi:hypothetical protein